MRPDRERGQATVELVALLPLVLAVALAAATVLAGQAASEQAAVAGAIALVHGNDARAAARTAIPEEARGRVDIKISGSRVTVSFRPRLPLRFLETALEASATADAGKAPNP